MRTKRTSLIWRSKIFVSVTTLFSYVTMPCSEVMSTLGGVRFDYKSDLLRNSSVFSQLERMVKTRIYSYQPSALFCSFCLSVWVTAAAAAEILALKHESRILGHSSNPVSGFYMMDQVRLCAVWPTENWLGTSKTTYRVGWMIWLCYSRALERRCLVEA